MRIVWFNFYETISGNICADGYETQELALAESNDNPDSYIKVAYPVEFEA